MCCVPPASVTHPLADTPNPTQTCAGEKDWKRPEISMRLNNFPVSLSVKIPKDDGIYNPEIQVILILLSWEIPFHYPKAKMAMSSDKKEQIAK